MTRQDSMQSRNLRQATGAERCGKCFMYKSLNEYKELVRRFGPASPIVTAYGYGEDYLAKDGICEISGDPPVLESEVCDHYMPA